MITIHLTDPELSFIKRNALAAEINGVSRMREKEDRLDNLKTDSLVGQMATAGLHKYWFGHITNYAKERWRQNLNPRNGDGGCDIEALNVDVKGSLIRYEQMKVDDYHLIVRPAEFHHGWVYVHALVNMNRYDVYLTGWAESAMFPGETENNGHFKGAFVLPVPELYPLMPLRHLWRKG